MNKASFTSILFLLLSNHLSAQHTATIDIKTENFTVSNRQVSFTDATAHLNGGSNAGFLWLNNSNFTNGTIELDIKGKNDPGRSFVGVAFHGKDDQTYDAIYFRPFNFKNPDRKNHSVQYISIPDNDWPMLRERSPGKYENQLNPVPEPVDDWFHVKIEVNYPKVKVYVNGSDKPVLEIDQISATKEGKIGFWVGNGSEGWFRNLKITNRN